MTNSEDPGGGVARSARTLLLVTRNFPPAQGGVETMASELAAHGPKAGIRVVLLHIGQAPSASPPTHLAAYHHVPGTGRLAALIVSKLAVPFYAWRHRPFAIVHLQVTTGLGGWLASRLFSTPYFVIGLGLELLPGRGFWRGLVLHGAKKVISISRYTDGLVSAIGVTQGCRAILNPGTRFWPDPPPGTDKDAVFGSGANGRFILLSICRLVPRKGVDKVLEALALVLRTRGDFLYCIGGSGPDLPRLQILAREIGVENHVHFLGPIPGEEMGSYFSRADLFVLTSRVTGNPPDAEGFGIVFLEAAGCGTPSLGGNSGGIPDAVRDGETGLLVDPNDPQAIADKILLLMSDPPLLKKLGDGARAHAREQSWDKVCSRYYGIFFPSM